MTTGPKIHGNLKKFVAGDDYVYDTFFYERNDMKRFIVDQTGFVQLEASRRFIIEVPDHISDEQAQELLDEGQVSLPDDEEGMEWWDTPDRKWVGYDVDIEDSDVYEPGIVRTDKLRVIRLEMEGATEKAMPQ